MTAWIHIGFGKTGTTTIQRFLSLNRKHLSELGVLYPALRGKKVPHHNLVHDLGRPARFNAEFGTWKDVGALVRRHPEHSILLSSESFQSLPASAIGQIQAHLRGRAVKIIVYLRRQSDLAESWYLQALKTGRTELPFDRFAERLAPLLFYSSVLDRWGARFGTENIHVRVFERARFTNGDLIDDFLGTVGLPLCASHPQYRSRGADNVTPGPRALAVARLVRGHLLEGGDPGALNPAQLTRITKHVLASAMATWGEEKSVRVMNRTERLAYDARFMQDNDLVVKKYLGARPGPLFQEEYRTDAATTFTNAEDALCCVSTEEVIGVLVGTMARLARRQPQPAEDSRDLQVPDPKPQ